MANEFYDLFNQLFYSTDVWGYLGIAIVVAFFFVVTYKVKFCFALFTPIMAFMAIDYLGKLTATGYYAFHFIILCIGSVFLTIMGIEGFAHNKR